MPSRVEKQKAVDLLLADSNFLFLIDYKFTAVNIYDRYTSANDAANDLVSYLGNGMPDSATPEELVHYINSVLLFGTAVDKLLSKCTEKGIKFTLADKKGQIGDLIYVKSLAATFLRWQAKITIPLFYAVPPYDRSSDAVIKLNINWMGGDSYDYRSQEATLTCVSKNTIKRSVSYDITFKDLSTATLQDALNKLEK